MGVDDYSTVVHPGDLIMGDLNGVVCIPKEVVALVAELLEPSAQANAKIQSDLKEGQLFAQSSKKHRATLATLPNS